MKRNIYIATALTAIIGLWATSSFNFMVDYVQKPVKNYTVNIKQADSIKNNHEEIKKKVDIKTLSESNRQIMLVISDFKRSFEKEMVVFHEYTRTVSSLDGQMKLLIESMNRFSATQNDTLFITLETNGGKKKKDTLLPCSDRKIFVYDY
jgi:hypothetical protein